LFCTRAAVGDYLTNRVIVRTPDGGFDQDACRKSVLKHLRERSAGRTGDSGADLSHERALLAKEQRETAALKNAIARGEYVRVTSVANIITNELLALRESFLGLPGAEADALAEGDPVRRAHIEDHLRAAVYVILENLSNPEAIAERAARDQRGSARRR
jgi:hypothetical protein